MFSTQKSRINPTLSSSTDLFFFLGTNLGSIVGCGRFTKIVINKIKLPPYEQSVIIGLLLSD
jgi:hypothetical protein